MENDIICCSTDRNYFKYIYIYLVMCFLGNDVKCIFYFRLWVKEFEKYCVKYKKIF